MGFSLAPSRVDLRRDVIEKSWASCRLQKRFSQRIHMLKMELNVAPDVPRFAVLDANRAVQLLTNVIGAQPL